MSEHLLRKHVVYWTIELFRINLHKNNNKLYYDSHEGNQSWFGVHTKTDKNTRPTRRPALMIFSTYPHKLSAGLRFGLLAILAFLCPYTSIPAS